MDELKNDEGGSRSTVFWNGRRFTHKHSQKGTNLQRGIGT